MWLKQFQAFQISFDFEKDLAPHLEEHHLKACPPHVRASFGWKTVKDNAYSLSIHGYSICFFGKEERMLPVSVIGNTVEEKIRTLTESRGYPLKRHERQQIKQDVEFDLLPKAFCIQKKWAVIFDAKRSRMYIQATSNQQIEMICALIHKSVPHSVDIQPIDARDDINVVWQRWLAHPEQMPHHLRLADRIQWIDSENTQKQIKCQGYDWEEDFADTWLNQGYIPQELSFIWRDLIQFNLNEKLSFKRVTALPELQEQIDANDIEAEDELTNLLLIGHTYQQLLDDMMSCFTSSEVLEPA